MVKLEEGKTYRVRYLVKALGGHAAAREGTLKREYGMIILRHSTLGGQVELIPIDLEELAVSDDTEVDFVLLGEPLEPNIS
jgi:hypothetical protein